MAELLALKQDVKGLTSTPILNADGSGAIKLEGQGLKPELRLTKAEIAQVMAVWSKPAPAPPAPPKPEQPPVSTASTFGGYSAKNPMPAGALPYAKTSPFNQLVPAGVLMPNSAEMVKFTLGSEVENFATGAGFSPFYFASLTDPFVELRIKGEGSSLSGRKIHCPVGAIPAPGSDAHMCIIQPNGEAYDLWMAAPQISEGYITANGAGVSNLDTGGGVCDVGGSNAASFGLMAGTIRIPELLAGVIPHALVCTVSATKKGTTAAPGFVYPANHSDGTSTDPASPRMGQLFCLSYTEEQILALNLHPWKAAIATAAATRGIYVCDSGGDGMGIKVESSASYTAFGLPDPLVAYGQANGAVPWEGKEVFHLNEGIDWAGRLHAIQGPSA